MSQESTFSFTVSVDAPGASPQGEGRPPPEDRFAVADLSEEHVGGGDMLARNPHNGRRMILAAELLNALSHCRNFRTMDEHVSALMEDGEPSPERARAIRAILQSVRDGGLTVSASELGRQLAPQAPGDSAPGAPVVVVITCDRPDALERLLRSIRESCDAGGWTAFHVVDDSRSTVNQARNRGLVERFAGRLACPGSWFGPDRARALVEGLVRSLPDLEEPIRFLTDRTRWADYVSTGVSRNIAQLLSVDCPLVVFDDDAVCQLYRPPFEQAGLEFSRGRRQAWFFDDPETQADRRLTDDEDVVHRLNRCLGLTVPEALAVRGVERLDPGAWSHADARLASALGRASRVLVTECGTIGDPGTQDYSWLASLPAESTRRLAREPDQSALALREARCWLGVDRPTFAPSANFSQITGFENRGFLPPYFPFGRGQDRVFGETVRFLHPADVTLVHPWAALHLRVPATHAAQRPRAQVQPSEFPGYLSFVPLEGHARCPAEGPMERLASLAGAFTDLAASSSAELWRLYAEHRLRDDAGQLAALDRSLALSEGGDGAWADWLRQRRARLLASMQSEPEVAGTREEAVAEWREAWSGFGDALRAWPTIRDAARRLRTAQ